MSAILFDGQRDGEEVIFTFRRHIITARKGLAWLFILSAIGVLPMLLWPNTPQMLWIFLGCVFLGLIGAIYAYILWYFSIYIVTDQRIRQISQKGLFKKSVVDLGLDKIQSISFGIPGWKAGIFKYGTILIQTSVGDLKISQVSHPEGIHNELQNVIQQTTKGNFS